MKPGIAMLAVTIPLVAVVAVLWLATDRDAGIEDAAPATEETRERLPLPEPIRRPPDVVFPDQRAFPAGPRVTAADIEEIRMRLLASIAEDFRADIEADIERLSPFDVNTAYVEELSRYRSDPAWPTIPVVPGVSGFEIEECPRSLCLSDLLARESDDPVWARPMESRILAELPGRASNGLPQVFVVCRQQTCGILLPGPEFAPSETDLSRAGRLLASDLGFSQHSVASRSDFQAIFLTTREQPPEMTIQ